MGRYQLFRYQLIRDESEIVSKPMAELERIRTAAQALEQGLYEHAGRTFQLRVNDVRLPSASLLPDEFADGDYWVTGNIAVDGSHEHDDPSGKKVLVPDWPFVRFMWLATPKQLLMVQENRSARLGKMQLARLLSDIIGRKMRPRGYIVEMKAVSKKSDFWKAVRSASTMYRVEVSVWGPNIGDGFPALDELLTELHGDSNTQGLSLSASNRDGNLRIGAKLKRILEPAVDMAAKGAGSWTIYRSPKGDKKTKPIRSAGSQGKVDEPPEPEKTDLIPGETARRLLKDRGVKTYHELVGEEGDGSQEPDPRAGGLERDSEEPEDAE